jgi:hypothetical protein
MTALCDFGLRWGSGPLSAYVAGILLPALIAFRRPDLMPVLGLTAYAVLFWTGPFASATAVFWSDWSPTWRAAWIVLIPVFVALTFLPLLV